MTTRILRWKGGYAGDMVMYLMHLSGYKIANVNFVEQISESGRVIINFDHVENNLSELDRISLDRHHRNSINHTKLVQEIRSLNNSWIKSHYYDNSFDDITTDIHVDADSLPFVMSANVYKTETLKDQKFQPFVKRIKNDDVKFKLALYNVGVDSLNTKTSAVFKIYVSDLIQGWQTLRSKLEIVDIRLGSNGKDFYEHWHIKNQKYFPKSRYLDLVRDKDYDHNHKDLSLVERYALMILSGKKFQILPDQIL